MKSIRDKPDGRGIPRLSVIIPTKDSARTLGRCLESVNSQGYPRTEIIVVDGFSTDGTCEIARNGGARLISCAGSVPESRNRGFAASAGDILLFIDSDMVLRPGLLKDIAGRMEGFGALVIPETGCGRGFISRCKSFEKECYMGDSGVESARAFTRPAFESVGGYDPLLHLAEDYDLHRRCGEKFPIGRARVGLLHDTGSLTLAADLRKSFRYGRSLPRFAAKKNSSAPSWLYSRKNLFFACAVGFGRDPPAALGLAALRAMEYAAGGMGMAAGILDGILYAFSGAGKERSGPEQGGAKGVLER